MDAEVFQASAQSESTEPKTGKRLGACAHSSDSSLGNGGMIGAKLF